MASWYHGSTIDPETQVIIYVEDVNDEKPVFTQQQYNRLGLRETAGIGTSVIVVRATDRDTGDGGIVTYTILSGSEKKFAIDESTGLITTGNYLDYETRTSYLMNISAMDQAAPYNRGYCTVYITLLNELDEPVQFTNASYEATLMENIPTGTEVVQIQAQSADNMNLITYRFDPDTSARTLSLFQINRVTGVITVRGQIDREKGDYYLITVIADDGGPKKDSTVGDWCCLAVLCLLVVICHEVSRDPFPHVTIQFCPEVIDHLRCPHLHGQW
eukprot:g47205.t1